MQLVKKKLTIFTLITLFVVAMCFSFLVLPGKAYGFTADYEAYSSSYEEGTDTGITEDYSYSVTVSGLDDYTTPDGLHYCVDSTINGEVEEYVEDQSYSLYLEYYGEGYVENAEEGDLGYYEYSDSGHDTDTYTDTVDSTEYTRDYDWSVEVWWKIIRQSVRVNDMTCYQVSLTEDNKFELVFWYEYANNNWVTVFDTNGNLVYRKDFSYGHPTVVVDLPNGTYTVKTFHEEGKILQEFTIGKS